MKPLVLWGGVDINPKIYNQNPQKNTQHANNRRDKEEIEQANNAMFNGVPIIGVCRGAQLLCVLNGGELWQHTEPTTQNHPIETKDNTTFQGNTAGCHHQIMKPQGNYEVIAWNPLLTKIWKDDNNFFIDICTPEIVWWPETKCLGIQHHPEWLDKHNPYQRYINQLIKDLGIDYEF